MLAKRIIPTILQRNGALVKGTRFNSWRSVGNAMQAARIHAARGVDELIYLDIGATPEGRGPDIDAVRAMTDGMFTPVTVGGGVRSIDDVRALLSAGADKVAVCTAAFNSPGLLKAISERFGRQVLVVSIDYTAAERVVTHCGTRMLPDRFVWGVVMRAKLAEEHGAGEILLTAVDRDGLMCGYDLETIRKVSEAVGIPVIANGGCKNYADMAAAIDAGASAVAAGALFQFTDCTPKGAAQYLAEQGYEVRI